MEIALNQIMELNHETAMRLWTKNFGRTTKAMDFAGREIYKGAYNDRNSEYGWNVDHIYPESKGGKTADYNLICCNIRTNDEKADSFPIFNANGQRFQIKKTQNHYEIYPLEGFIIPKKDQYKGKQLNFYDSAVGIEYIDFLDDRQSKERFVGTITVKLSKINCFTVVDFVEDIFEDENIIYKKYDKFYNTIEIIIKDYNMPYKSNIANLLDKCVLLNTYLSKYFKPLNYITSFGIAFTLTDFLEREKIYDTNTNLEYSHLDNTIYINKLVKDNLTTEEQFRKVNQLNYYTYYDSYYEYDYVFTNLAKNLEKEVSEE